MLGLPIIGTLTVPVVLCTLLTIVIVAWLSRSPKPKIKAHQETRVIHDVADQRQIQSNAEEPEQNSCSKGSQCCQVGDSNQSVIQRVKILYGTTTGNAKSMANQLAQSLEQLQIKSEVLDVSTYDFEEKLTHEASENAVLVLIISTYTEGTPPESAKWFYQWLEEAAKDFRTQHSILQGLKFAVFGLGNSLYQDHFNTIAKNCDKYFYQLSAIRFHSLGIGDENVAGSKHGNLESDFDHWKSQFLNRLQRFNSVESCGTQSEEKTSDLDTESTDGSESGTDSEFSDADENEADEDGGDGLVDLEDIGNVMKKAKDKKKQDAASGPREMITPSLRKSLTKQGYKLIGSHSGVKICRWTKAMLRGRGGCYKHTFYGIASHQCMETTPSLACANKCVFCWRHHSNPVGTEWRWQMDPPDMILDGALENHYKMIKQMKGVPGVLPEKLEEGMNVQHCALSLVGEPIMYPEINRFVELLHEKSISSFLVTNAQFPEAIRDISPVTQLYVSIDASTKDSLKKIDRPLFRDFWERFMDSLKELSRKGQRTVYRLTLVKGWNAEEMDNYAKLVDMAKPDFIEVKGVTYCGTSKASTLTMDNVPWHEEVLHFVRQLTSRLPDYEISCEHEHSNCVLVSHKKFLVNGKWHTWINYPKFHQLVREFKRTNGTQTFSALDYMAETPNWAVFGSEERGFDPEEKRFHRKSKQNQNDG